MAEDDLSELTSLFSEPDAAVAEKRRDVVKTIQENQVSSFPSDLSITAAMDDLLQCFALGGQVRNYYRYGSYTTCQAQREKFWFALWNGSFSETPMNPDKLAANPRELERRLKVQEFYKQKLLEKKALGSSEDIWDERKTLLHSPFKE